MIKTQTHIPVKYEDLTPDQKKEITNGCGGKGGWVKPPHKLFFEASCAHHDYGYWKGCTEANRLAADKMLYRLMVFDCLNLPWYQKIRYRPWCWVYYQAIRWFGWKFFSYGNQKRYPEIERGA